MLKHFRSGKKRIRTLWWILTIGTVASFIGLFVFRSGTGIDDAIGTNKSGAIVGKVGGVPITDAELADATTLAMGQYKQQYGAEPTGRDAALLKEQVWSNVVTQKALSATATRSGMGVTDAEIVYAVHNTPPQDVASNPAFQTNGRFDPAKWTQALNDPNINWFPLEQRMRDQLPGQRLEERMIAGVKISEPELRRTYVNQYELAQVTGALLPLDAAIDTTKLNDGALKSYYDAHKDEFGGPAQVEVELVSIPRSVGAAEIAQTGGDAADLVRQLRGGADFAAIAKASSEGPFADKGGDFGQDLSLSRLPPNLAGMLARMPIGGVSDTIRDGNTYFIFKVLSRKDGPDPSVRLAQIQKIIHPSMESVQKDAARIVKLRKEATGGKLADAAARQQLVSLNTGWFGAGEFVPSLIQMPQVEQWGTSAKKGDVSRAFANDVGWVVAQVTDRREAGPRSFDQVRLQVRQAVELTLRQAKPLHAAQALVAAVKSGMSLEAAAQAQGVGVFHTQPFPRTNPDPTLTATPRAVGVAFGLSPGDVSAPIPTTGGVLVLRKDAEMGGNAAQYDSLKGSLSQTLLTSRQRRYVTAWLAKVASDSKVDDLRPPVEDALSQ